MIEYLSGKIAHKEPSHIVLNVSGVGYTVETSLKTFAQLPGKDQSTDLWIFTRVREDAIKLFGFHSRNQREIFMLLLKVNKVGPKVALAILSTIEPHQLVNAIHNKDTVCFTQVPGIGKTLADKLIFELTKKIKSLTFYSEIESSTPLFNIPNAQTFQTLEIENTLTSLGFKPANIKAALTEIDTEQLEISQIIKEALKILAVKKSLIPSKKNKTKLDATKIF